MQELRCADTVCVKIKAICAFRRQEKFFKCIEYRSGDVTSPCLPISGSKQRTWPSIRGDSCPFVSVRVRSCPFVPVRARSLISDTGFLGCSSFITRGFCSFRVQLASAAYGSNHKWHGHESSTGASLFPK